MHDHEIARCAVAVSGAVFVRARPRKREADRRHFAPTGRGPVAGARIDMPRVQAQRAVIAVMRPDIGRDPDHRFAVNAAEALFVLSCLPMFICADARLRSAVVAMKFRHEFCLSIGGLKGQTMPSVFRKDIKLPDRRDRGCGQRTSDPRAPSG